MTNLQRGAPVLSPTALKRLWFGAPAAALGVGSLVLVASVLAPMWQALQKDSASLRQLEELQVQVSLMRQQLRAMDLQEEKALQQREKLFRMIAGSGDVSTLLTVLDREAKASGVRMDLYEPQAAAAPAAPAQGAAPPPAGNQAQAPPPNPLELAGLQPQGMLISLRGPYPNLLTFLRRLESLNLLVIQSDLRLEVPAPSDDPKKVVSKDVTMKLSLKVYGKPAGAEAAAATPAAPAAGAPGSPAAPGAATPGAPAPATPPGSTPPPPAAGAAQTPPANAPAAAPAAQGGSPAPAAPPAAGAPPAGR